MASVECYDDSQVVTHLKEYERLARRTLPKEAYDFISGGAEDMWTLRENIRAFQTIRLRPQFMMDVSRVQTSTEVLGFKVSMPIMIGPTSLHKMAHSEGELGTARAASAENTVMVLSSSSTTTLEDVNMTGPGVRFFQLYMYKDRRITAEVVRRADRAGYKAIVLTGDSPYLGKREADIKNRFTLPPNLTLINFEGAVEPSFMSTTGSTSVVTAFTDAKIDKSVTWKDIAWLKDITSLPILIKGVLTAEDARLAVKSGVAGIVVSNHGGRQLDYSPPTIDVLEEVVEAVEGKVPIFCDGGIRHGSDVFKALALGAAGVLVGRPVVYGLAVDGEAGVRKILQTLRDEFQLAMSMAGCRRVQDIRRTHIQIRKEITVSLGSKL